MLVVIGYNHVVGIDYLESFFPVAKMVTIWALLTVSATKDWSIRQLDINNVFLHCFIDEDVYMLRLEGYSKVTYGQVSILKCFLYGLKQASWLSSKEFTSKLHDFGFLQSSNDPCLFVKPQFVGHVSLIVYVNDVLVMRPLKDLIDEVEYFLHSNLQLKTSNWPNTFLSWNWHDWY